MAKVYRGSRRVIVESFSDGSCCISDPTSYESYSSLFLKVLPAPAGTVLGETVLSVLTTTKRSSADRVRQSAMLDGSLAPSFST